MRLTTDSLWHHFQGELILQSVGWYCISYRESKRTNFKRPKEFGVLLQPRFVVPKVRLQILLSLKVNLTGPSSCLNFIRIIRISKYLFYFCNKFSPSRGLDVSVFRKEGNSFIDTTLGGKLYIQ